jgi:4,5-DOPA dioxygenase extradiol
VADHPDFAMAVPTPDHFIPLLYLSGLAAFSSTKPDALVRGYAMGSLSMTCYGIDSDLACRDETGAAALPADVPADQTNI